MLKTCFNMTEQQFLTERQLIIKQKTESIKNKQLLEYNNNVDRGYIYPILKLSENKQTSLEEVFSSAEELTSLKNKLYNREAQDIINNFFVGDTKKDQYLLRRSFIDFFMKDFICDSDIYVEMQMPSGRSTKPILIRNNMIEFFLQEALLQDLGDSFKSKEFILTLANREQYIVKYQSDLYELWILKIKT